MFKYIWLVPLLPLIGAAINGLLGRKLRFSEQIIGGIAVGSVALAFLISVAAVYSYGFGGHAEWPKPYLTSQDGFSFDWIPGGANAVAGQIFTVFVIVVAAAEAAIGLGIVIALYRNKETIWVDEIDLLKW